jgi:hypothetical protein
MTVMLHDLEESKRVNNYISSHLKAGGHCGVPVDRLIISGLPAC